jgi:hypothetical protein
MRALPGPASGSTHGSPGGAGGYVGGGFHPQPMVAFLVPAVPLVLMLGVAWGADFVTGAWCSGHGCTPTGYLREAVTVLAEVAAAAAALVGLVASYRTGWLLRAVRWLLVADALAALLAVRGLRRLRARQVDRRAGALARRTVVRVEAVDLPRPVAAEPSATYPMPDLTQILDAEVVA